MKTGDVVVCIGPQGYSFTLNKEYTVLAYEPEEDDLNFRWPAYVTVTDDYGKEVMCHAHRFKERSEMREAPKKLGANV